MTRCLDCGSERTTDQCPSCGLTTAAAEVVFRRRLVFRTAIFLLGSLAFPYVSQIFPPLDNAKNISYHPTAVVGRFNMKGLVRGTRRLSVRSWRPGQTYERLAVDTDDFDRFNIGDLVEVAVEPG